MFLSILKFFQGFVRVRLYGYAPERFLNLCSNHDIVLWNLVYKDESYEFYISVHAFRQLGPIRRKTKTKLQILERHGFPFFLYRYRKRKLFFIGIIFFGLILFVISNFIWNIEINGNQTITDQTILTYLKEQETYFGTNKHSINCSSLEEKLRLSFTEIIWTSVRIDGTKMTIDIQENLPTSEQQKPADGIAYDLVANKNAVISSIITRNGTPLVLKNSEVKKGDILVSGRLDIFDDNGEIANYNYCVADADIYGYTSYSYTDEFQRSYEKEMLTGNKRNYYYISAFGQKIPFYLREKGYSNYHKYSNETQIHICSDFYLPIAFGKELVEEYTIQNNFYTKSEAKQIAEEKIALYLEKLCEKDIQIIEKNVIVDIDEKKCRASGTIKALEPIGVYQPTEVLEVPADEGNLTDELN